MRHINRNNAQDSTWSGGRADSKDLFGDGAADIVNGHADAVH